MRTYGLLEVTPGRGTYVKVPNMHKLAVHSSLFYDMLSIPLADRVNELHRFITQAFDEVNNLAYIKSALFQLHQYQLTAHQSPSERATCFCKWLKTLILLPKKLSSMEIFQLECTLCSLEKFLETHFTDNDELLKVVHAQMFCANSSFNSKADITKIQHMLKNLIAGLSLTKVHSKPSQTQHTFKVDGFDAAKVIPSNR